MIECSKLTKRYGKTLALDGLDLSVGDGEMHGFVGPNGAGKTTAIRILATLMRPTSGDACIDGVSVTGAPQNVRRMIGYMPDFFGVYDDLKAWEYLDFYAGCMGLSAKERRRRIDEALDLTMLTDKREAYVDSLSRGMKQRLCLAHLMMHDPKLLILDEPASGMDPRARAEMRDILKEICAMGKTVLISSHILPELAQMCSSISILEKGRLTFTGTVEALERRMSAAQLVIRFEREPNEGMAVQAMGELADMLGAAVKREGFTCWRIDAPADAAKDGEALRTLVGLGLPVCDFHRERATLERVFMEVTRHEDQSDL